MGRTPCCNAEDLKKGAWTAAEDQKLIAFIQEHGEGGWRTLPQKAGLQRCGKSCRLRWVNYLRPDIKRGEFTVEEEQEIIQLHTTLGNRWSAIARHLPRRTDNEIKNYWNTHLKKRLNSSSVAHQNKPSNNTVIGPSSSKSSDPTTNNPDPTQKLGSDSGSCRRPSSSTSIQLLNKLAAKLASSRSCLDHQALRDRSQSQLLSRSLSSTQLSDGNSAEKDGIIAINGTTFDVNSPSLVLGSPDNNGTILTVMPSKPAAASRSSAWLLNKMATRLSCLNTLKSLLSESADGQQGNGPDGSLKNMQHFTATTAATTTSSNISDSTNASTTASAMSWSVSPEVPNEMTHTTDFAPVPEEVEDPFDLDLLKDWEGISTESMGMECDVDYIIGGSRNDGVSLEIDSPLSPLSFVKNNNVNRAEGPSISGCESSELSDSLGTSTKRMNSGELLGLTTKYDNELAFASHDIARDDVYGPYQY